MRFLEAQLNLLVKLCLGDNVKVIEALTKEPVISEGSNSLGIQITFNQIMFALSVKMPPEIKTLYVKLLQGTACVNSSTKIIIMYSVLFV